MRPLTLLFSVAGLAVIGALLAHRRAAALRGSGAPIAALPSHHGWFVALCALTPALVFLALWQANAPAFVSRAVLATPEAATLPPPGFERAAILGEARALAAGRSGAAFHPAARRVAPAYRRLGTRFDRIAAVAAIGLALVAGWAALSRVRAGFAARRRVEQLVMALLLAASLIAILTTAGIVLSLVWEAGRFFQAVPVTDFLFGTHWNPQLVDPADPGRNLGAVPLFWGTFLIGAVIAMLVAVPLGLLAAVHLTQYASPRARGWLKPALEVLAGVPTVVYGYFAALSVAPAVRDAAVRLGFTHASAESALAAGLVMGIMIIPFVSSVADDSLAAVPAAMRDGSLALGATPSETVRRVLLPAALPGIAGGVLLAISRAIGETMIVVMAASSVATLTADPLAPATTVSRQIVDLLTGEAEFDSPKTLAAFALGLTLFAATLLLNIVALGIVKRHRERYE